MDNMKFFAAFFLFISLVHADDVDLIVQGNVEFSKSLYEQILKTESGNVVLSPLSTQLILALTQLGAKGTTAEELTRGLHLPVIPIILKKGMKDLITHLKGNRFYDLHTANKIYVSQKLDINPDIQKDSEKYFDTYIDSIDFSNTKKAAGIINQWIEKRTNNKIKNMVPPEMLSSQTSLLLVNTLHFQAKWLTTFKRGETAKRKFFKSEYEDIKAVTMHQVGLFKYFENKQLNAQLIQLPYEGSDISFTIILPNRVDGLRAVENKLNDFFVPQNYSYERLSLYLPKFKIASDFNLIPPLEKLGIKKAFSGGDLSGLLANGRNVRVSDVFQKSIIEIDEEGTEAAAATVVVGTRLGRTPSFFPAREVRVDRPFFYVINCGKLPLFIGRVTDPTA